VRVLALDYGSARCGCAVSDPTGTIVTPLEHVVNAGSKRGLARLRELADELGAERIVVGLPLSLAGGDSEQTRATRQFAAALQGRVGERVPVELYDERFTTSLARRTGERDPAGARTSEDSRAAAHLLEGWLAARSR
jgi:putative Holliday junction resolvase